MGASHFTGPIVSGPILNTSGTTLGQDVADWGILIAGQAMAIDQVSTTAVSTSIVIPAYSVITAINVIVSTNWTGTITVGTSATATELVATGPTLNIGAVSCPPTTQANALLWANTGANDVRIFVKAGATGSGVGTLVVAYLQAENVTT